MAINLLWIATKQLRLSQWLYNKLFDLGLALHSLRKYGKIDPEIWEFSTYKNHKIYNWQARQLRWNGINVPEEVIDKSWEDPEFKLESQFAYLASMARDLLNPKNFTHDSALRDEVYLRFLAEYDKLMMRLNNGKRK